MSTLRLTALLSVAFLPFLLPEKAFSQSVPLDQRTTATRTSQMAADTATSTTTIAQVNTEGQSGATSQPSNASPPASNLQTPGLQTPGVGLQTPGSNLQTPGSNLQTPGAGLRTPGVGPQTSGVDAQTPGIGSQTPGVGSQTSGVGSQTPGVGSQTSGVGSQTPGVGSQTPGTIQTTTGQPTNAGQASPGTGTTQTLNGQPVQLSPSTAVGTTGAAPFPVNGQPTGNQSIPTGLNGTQVNPSSVLYPPQIIQGGSVAPSTQPSTGTSATGTSPLQPQLAPGAAATRTVAPGQASPTQLQSEQGTLDTALQQATCAQNWQQAIQLVNVAIASTPASQAGYRSQLASYRSRLQTLRAKGVRAPNWAQQCRGGSVANIPEQ